MLASLDIEIEALSGVGPKRGLVLREAGISSVGDLLKFAPRRYLDRSQLYSIADAPIGQELTLIGTVDLVPPYKPRRRGGSQPPLRVAVKDQTGSLSCIWFRGGHMGFATGDVVALSGVIEEFRGSRQMVHPEVEVITEDGRPQLHTGGIIPLYTASVEMRAARLQSRGMRRLTKVALETFGESIEETLPQEVRTRCGLSGLRESVWALHFPKSLADSTQARERLAFEELFELQCELLRRRAARLASVDGIPFRPDGEFQAALLKTLPYELTSAQEKALKEISIDMALPCRMNRLLHGEVGSGKTIVAALAMASAVDSGFQTVLMAPTELLAEQHFTIFISLFKSIGIQPHLLVGGRRSGRRETLEAIRTGAARIVIGTHALIQEDVHFAHLGLIVVDEEHRFGVVQRHDLRQKGSRADLLVMTATPIPRSLALTLYGDLDVSVLDEVPSGRLPVRTVVRSPDKLGEVIAFVADQLSTGKQAFIVYPIIEDSEKVDLASAKSGFDDLARGALAQFEVRLLHGRLQADERAAVMEGFSSGEIQALVCTTVIEVGVDVPNATVMVVEHAERFGLAQLHQLRGRVGRGADPSLCVLIQYPTEGTEVAVHSRLEALCSTSNGFDIADADLKLRGPGEMGGIRQAGLPDLLIADLSTDEALLVEARVEAGNYLEAGGVSVGG